MKNLLTIALGCCLLALPLVAEAQSEGIKKFYDKYKDYESIMSVKLQGWMIRTAAKFAEEDDAEAARILQHITRIRVLMAEDKNRVAAKDLLALKSNLRTEQFEPLMSVREGKTMVDFFIKETKEGITDVVILVNEENEFLMLNLEGLLKFEDLHKLNFDVEGGDYFKKLPAKKSAIPRA